MTPDELKTWAEIVQNSVTALGIAAAGVWSFFTFVIGRSFRPNVQIQFELKKTMVVMESRVAIVTVRLKNIGKTRLRKRGCYVASESINLNSAILGVPWLSRLDTPIDFSRTRVYEVFNMHDGFEPGEETMDELLLLLGELSAFKVSCVLEDVGKTRWTSTAILTLDKSPVLCER